MWACWKDGDGLGWARRNGIVGISGVVACFCHLRAVHLTLALRDSPFDKDAIGRLGASDGRCHGDC
jgi:hypothetical protein